MCFFWTNSSKSDVYGPDLVEPRSGGRLLTPSEQVTGHIWGSGCSIWPVEQAVVIAAPPVQLGSQGNNVESWQAAITWAGSSLFIWSNKFKLGLEPALSLHPVRSGLSRYWQSSSVHSSQRINLHRVTLFSSNQQKNNITRVYGCVTLDKRSISKWMCAGWRGIDSGHKILITNHLLDVKELIAANETDEGEVAGSALVMLICTGFLSANWRPHHTTPVTEKKKIFEFAFKLVQNCIIMSQPHACTFLCLYRNSITIPRPNCYWTVAERAAVSKGCARLQIPPVFILEKHSIFPMSFSSPL